MKKSANPCIFKDLRTLYLVEISGIEPLTS